jgi:hypothetical protein
MLQGGFCMVSDVVLAHWYQLFDTFSFSTMEFYTILSDKIGVRQMPETWLSRENLPEGGLLSAKREYLKIKRGEQSFMLCAAPFGVDFFVSWWLLENPGCLSGCLTVLIPPLAFITRRTTFYKEDTTAVFRDAVHACVLETVDQIFKGVNRTFEGSREPTVRTRLL